MFMAVHSTKGHKLLLIGIASAFLVLGILVGMALA